MQADLLGPSLGFAQAGGILGPSRSGKHNARPILLLLENGPRRINLCEKLFWFRRPGWFAFLHFF